MKNISALLRAVLVGLTLMVVSGCALNLRHPITNPRGLSDDHRPARIAWPNDDVKPSTGVEMEDFGELSK